MPFNVDPQTGLMTNTPDLQPLGAMGAVVSLLNSGRATDIANTLQQSRQAQAQLEAEHAQEYAAATQRAQQLRDTLSQYVQNNPDADTQGMMNAAIGSGSSDVGTWTPLMRSMESGQAKRDVAGITGASRENVADINQGVTGAPKPTAQAAAANATAGLRTAEAGVVPGNAKAKQDLDAALAALARARAAVAGKSQLTDQETKNLYSYLKTIETVRARYATDKMAFMDPTIAAQISQLDSEIADTKARIAAKTSPANATAAPQLPSWMGGGTVGSTTPASGQPTAGGGASSPITVPLQLPPLPK